MTKELKAFYQKQIEKFQELRGSCSYPLRVDYLISCYEEVLKKLGDKYENKSERQTTL